MSFCISLTRTYPGHQGQGVSILPHLPVPAVQRP